MMTAFLACGDTPAALRIWTAQRQRGVLPDVVGATAALHAVRAARAWQLMPHAALAALKAAAPDSRAEGAAAGAGSRAAAKAVDRVLVQDVVVAAVADGAWHEVYAALRAIWDGGALEAVLAAGQPAQSELLYMVVVQVCVRLGSREMWQRAWL
jgi:hypothetical protein